MKRMRLLVGMLLLAGSGIEAQEATEPAAPGAGAEERSEREPVLMVGDSMMKLLSIAFEKAFRQADIEAASFASLGSGLVRLDAFDWFGKVDELMQTHRPGAVVVMLGANDNQTLLSDAGVTIPRGSAAWDAAYAARLGRMMDRFAEQGARRVIWILLPDMQQPAHQRYAERLNALLADVARERPFVTLFDPRPTLRRRTKASYTATLVGPDGQIIQVRSPDGVHLSKDGAERLAGAVMRECWR